MLEYQKGRRTHNNTTFGLSAAHSCHDTLDSTLTPVSAIFEANQTAMANMAATQADLLQQLETMHERYAALAAGQQQQQPKALNPRPTPQSSNTTLVDKQYCWTHGFNVSNGHTSATCTRQASGHQTPATRSNTMGDSNKGHVKANAAKTTPDSTLETNS